MTVEESGVKDVYKDMLMRKVERNEVPQAEEYSRFKESILDGKDYGDKDEDSDGDYDAGETGSADIAFREDDDELTESDSDDDLDVGNESFVLRDKFSSSDELAQEDVDEDSYSYDMQGQELDSEADGDDEELLYWDQQRKFNVVTRIILVVCSALFVYCIMTGNLTSTSNNVVLSPSTSANLQKQINHLYSEFSQSEQKHVQELDRTLKVVVAQFEKNIKKLIPKNIKNLQTQVENLNERFNKILNMGSSPNQNQITVTNITQWQQSILSTLNITLPTKIPVVVNNSSQMLIIPEMHKYISDILNDIVHASEPFINVNNNGTGVKNSLGYDLNKYVKEVLSNEFQYVDKKFFLQELNRNLQLNKHEILEEVAGRLSHIEDKYGANANRRQLVPEQYSTILLKNLVKEIYNTNHYRWEDDLDFATAAQGARLVKHLTSSTYNYKNGNGITPLELLSDSSLSRGSTYWQCVDSKSCSWTIRFNNPIYLTRLSYFHGRFTNNLHMMTSAPKSIAVYVKLAKSNPAPLEKTLKDLASENLGKDNTFKKDSSYILISNYEYDIHDRRIRQNFPLPDWYIQLKPLIRSIAFVVNQNNGNSEFTSLRKYVINGVTASDLKIIDSNEFTINRDQIPEFSEHHAQIHPKPPSPKTNNIKAFGQDELDI